MIIESRTRQRINALINWFFDPVKLGKIDKVNINKGLKVKKFDNVNIG